VHGIQPNAVQEVLTLVGPLWVDPEAAAPLRNGVLRGSARYDVALNGLRLGAYTAESYVRRAYPDSTLPIFDRIPDNNAGDVVAHITVNLRAEARKAVEELALLEDEDIDEQLNSDGVRRFVYVPWLLNDMELARLRARYPGPTFIFGTGASLPTTPPPAGVRFLAPELDTAREKLAFKEWIDARTNVANRRKRVGGG
jgi:hypothetical protein